MIPYDDMIIDNEILKAISEGNEKPHLWLLAVIPLDGSPPVESWFHIVWMESLQNTGTELFLDFL